MTHVKKWNVEIFIGEDGPDTTAEARLVSGESTSAVVGRGKARQNPRDPSVPEIGDEVAVGRALVQLGTNLLAVAQADIEAEETRH